MITILSNVLFSNNSRYNLKSILNYVKRSPLIICLVKGIKNTTIITFFRHCFSLLVSFQKSKCISTFTDNTLASFFTKNYLVKNIDYLLTNSRFKYYIRKFIFKKLYTKLLVNCLLFIL